MNRISKIINFQDNTTNKLPKFGTKNKKWNGVYSSDKEIKFKTSMLKSILCGGSDAYTF